MGKELKDRFKLLKKVGKYKKGKIFESYGGLVRGIITPETEEPINFDNKEFFKLVK